MIEFQESSGLFTGDLDHQRDPREIKQRLAADPYVASCFISPSEDGIKFLIPIPHVSNDAEYKRAFTVLQRYFKGTYGLTLDEACKDVGRLCFISDDPDLFVMCYARPPAKHRTPAERERQHAPIYRPGIPYNRP